MSSTAGNTSEKANVETNTPTGVTTNTSSNTPTDTIMDLDTGNAASVSSTTVLLSGTSADNPSNGAATNPAAMTADSASDSAGAATAISTAPRARRAEIHYPPVDPNPKRFMRDPSLQSLELIRQLHSRCTSAAAKHDTIMRQITDLEEKVSIIAKEQVDAQKLLGRVLRVLGKMNAEAVEEAEVEEKEEEEKYREEQMNRKGKGKWFGKKN